MSTYAHVCYFYLNGNNGLAVTMRRKRIPYITSTLANAVHAVAFSHIAKNYLRFQITLNGTQIFISFDVLIQNFDKYTEL